MIYQVAQTRGAALAPLSSRQRQKLAAMARYAYEEVAPDATFDDWRHDECQRIVGKPGLTACCNADYNPLKSHFLQIAGNSAGALRASLKAQIEPREWAYASLLKACKEAEDVMPQAMKYARGFVRNKRGVSLDDADDRTIWHAIFTIRRKAQSLRKKKAGGESAADVLAKIMGSADGAPAAGTRPRTTRTRYMEGPF